jgi:hypothetical protein
MVASGTDRGSNAPPQEVDAVTGLTPRATVVSTYALGVMAAAAGVITFFVPDILRGTPAMNGSARGTGLVVLAVVPILLTAMIIARRGSDRAVIVWLGSALFLIYNSVMFLFATPFNSLFLVYVAMLGLSLATAAAILITLDIAALAAQFSPDTPTLGLAIYVWVVVAGNTVIWLRRILPELGAAGTPEFLEGSGLTTNPIFVQDLAVWLPLAAVAAWWLRQRRPAGYLLVGAYLVMWVAEAVTIASDQWFGHRADATATIVSGSVVLPFLVLAVVAAVPLLLLLRRLPRRTR